MDGTKATFVRFMGRIPIDIAYNSFGPLLKSESIVKHKSLSHPASFSADVHL